MTTTIKPEDIQTVYIYSSSKSPIVGVYLNNVDKLGRFSSKRETVKFLRENGYVEANGFEWYHIRDAWVRQGGDEALSDGYVLITQYDKWTYGAEAIYADGTEDNIAFGGGGAVFQVLDDNWSGWDWKKTVSQYLKREEV
ncbi:hypothetical protein WGM54_14145 [Paenibacillus polymyxa]|uniref:hypothetical protein n=1 Tax=Paenibacillus polymyxa TaxID=1406 RepID=UPI00307E17FE